MQMQISHTETEQGVVVIAVSGRVMLGTESQKIETTLEQFISKGRRKFVFDLSGVKYIDSTGIGRFISGLNKVMQAGGKLRMAGAQGIVREGFRVTRLDTVFEFFDDLDKACQGMG